MFAGGPGVMPALTVRLVRRRLRWDGGADQRDLSKRT
jgi:hypothetical protein